MQQNAIPSRFIITTLGGSSGITYRCRWNPSSPETLNLEGILVPSGTSSKGAIIHLVEDPWRPRRYIAYRRRGITIAKNIWGNYANPDFWQDISTTQTSLENFSSGGSTQCPVSVDGYFGTLVASPARKDFFGWIAHETVQNVVKSYFIYTPDNFQTFFVSLIGQVQANELAISSHTGELWVSSIAGQKVWHSSNWGQTWTETNISFAANTNGAGSIHIPSSTRNGTPNILNEGIQAALDYDSYFSGWNGVSNPINLPELPLPLTPPTNYAGSSGRFRIRSFAKDGNYVSMLVANGEPGHISLGLDSFLLVSDNGGQSFTVKPSHRLPLNEGVNVGGILTSTINSDFILAYGRHDPNYVNTFTDIPQSNLIYTLDRGNTWRSLVKSPRAEDTFYPIDVVSDHSTVYANDVPDQPFNDGPSDCSICYAGIPKSDNPVELRHGEKYEEVTDLALNSPAGDLTFARTYRQTKIWDSAFQFMGMGWTHNHNIKLREFDYHVPASEGQQEVDPEKMYIVQLPGGGEAFFKGSLASGHYLGYDGVGSELVQEGGGFALTGNDKSVYHFGPNVGTYPGSPLLSRNWPNGEVWTYSYRTTFPVGELDEVADGYGRKLVLRYYPSGHARAGQLFRVGDHTFNDSDPNNPTGRYIEFTYQFNKLERNGQILDGTNNLLKKVLDVRKNLWTYDYYGQQSGETLSERLNFLTKVTSPVVDVTGGGDLQPITVKELTYTTVAQELAVDGGMENEWGTPQDGWQAFNGLTTDRSTTHDPTAGGSYARHFVTSLGNQGIESKSTFVMQAGRTYHITARVLPSQGGIKMLVTPPDTLDLANGISEHYTDKLGVGTSGTGSWQTLETVFTPVRTTSGHRLRFATIFSTPNEIYIDNVSIREIAVNGLHQLRGNALIATDYTFHNPDNTTIETTAGLSTTHMFTNGVLGGTANAAGNYVAQHINKQYRPDRLTDARGNDTLMEWSTDGKQLLKVTDAREQSTQFSYNSNGTLNYSIDATGRKTQYIYGDSNQPRLPTEVKVFEPDGTTLFRWQKFEYDLKGRTTKEQTLDANSPATPVVQQETTHEYYTSGNGNGLLYRITQKDLVVPANNQSTTYDYDAAGRAIKTTQNLVFGNCIKTFTLYDNAGNVIASICNYEPGAAANPQTIAQVLALFNEVSNPDQNKITLHEYDPAGRRFKTTTNAGATYAQVSLAVYDALGRVIRTITNYVSSGTIPDPYTADRNLFSHGLLSDKNLITDTFYNAAGQVRKQIDAMGNATLFGYDNAGRIVKMVSSASQPNYDNDYGLNGHPDLAGYPAGNAPDQDIITLSEYDQAGNLVKSSEILKVDANGNPIASNVTLYGYDELNRQVAGVRNASKPDYFADRFFDPELKNYESRLVEATYVPSADKDLMETSSYDVAGNLVSRKVTVDTQGTGTSTTFIRIETLTLYDNRGRVMRTIQNYVPQPSVSPTDPKDWVWDSPQWKTSTGTAVDHGSKQDQNIITDTVYDDHNRVMYTLDTLGRRTWTAYDGLGRVIKTIVNAVGTATDGGVNDPRSTSYILSADSDKDQISITTYDENGRVKYTQDPLGRRTWHAYDTLGRPVKTVVNAVGMAEDYGTGDPRGSGYVPSADADKDIITRTQYGTQDRVNFTYDVMNSPTKYFYDDLGRTLKTTVNYVDGNFDINFPDQDVSQSTLFELTPHRTTTTDARGTQTQQVYDKLGRVVKVISALGVTNQESTTYTCYDKLGRVLRTIQNYHPQTGDPSPDARDATTGAWLFNPVSHGTDNDENLITEYTLDSLGRVTTTRNAKGITASVITYTKDGQVISTKDALLHVTRYVYDKMRRRSLAVLNYQETSGDPAGWKWSTSGGGQWVNVFLNPITFGSATNPDQNIIAQGSFDRAGRLLSVRDPGGKLVEYTYDLLNRRTNLKVVTNNPANDQNWQTVFTKLGNTLRTSLIDPNNITTTRDTDQVGRLSYLQFGAETPRVTPEVTFSYNKAGSLLAMNEWVGGESPMRSTLRQFDMLQRTKQVDFYETGITTQSVQYAYDGGGLRTKMTLPGNLSIQYEYDERGLMKTLKDWDLQVTSLNYDQVGRLKTVQRPGYVFSVYGYDVIGQFLSLAHSRQPLVGSAVTLGTFDYTVDAVGNRVDVVESVRHVNGTTSASNHHHSYDALSRLTQTVQREGSVPGTGTIQMQYDYRYDVSGNRKQKINTVAGTPTTTDFSYESNNRLLTVNGVSQSYDSNGNLLTGNQAWDRANRLRQADETSYTYNGMGQRVSQNDGSKTTRYLLDLQTGLEKILTTEDSAVTRYVHGPGILHGSAAGQQGVSRYALQDGLGSIRSVVNTTGTIQEVRDYSPYGELMATEGTNSFLFGYTGEPADANGLLYLRARYYHPNLGVFPNLDPHEGDMGNPLSVNRYAYVQANPVNFTDPIGLEVCLPTPSGPICLPDPQVLRDFVFGAFAAGAAIIGALAAVVSATDNWPCSKDGSGEVSWAPWGYSGDLRHAGLTPKQDILCWLGKLGGEVMVSMYKRMEILYGTEISFEAHPITGRSYFAAVDKPAGGTIHVAHPAIMKGTRADSLASLVEEIWHAAQYHDQIETGDVNCHSSLYEGELQAQTQKWAWIRAAISTNLIREQAIQNTLPLNATPLMKNVPLFRGYTNSESVCPKYPDQYSLEPWPFPSGTGNLWGVNSPLCLNLPRLRNLA